MSSPRHEILIDCGNLRKIASVITHHTSNDSLYAVAISTADMVINGGRVVVAIFEHSHHVVIQIFENPPAQHGHHCHGEREAIINAVEKSTQIIMTKVSELNTALLGVSDKLTKIKNEITAEIETLKGQIGADADIPADAQETLNRLTGKLQELDDIVPDAATPTPTPEPTPEPTPAPSEPVAETPAPAPSDGVPPV